ncbi:protein kinase domain-containing protein [Legionella brunensis]|uniref:Serine/threonine-protein kinase n=1 Tax=Legionella brunensis TaxID=29422 RepID=A0A0W0S4V3_9GAMM|nr:protein kinase [Legionella brunensis]KTC78061.1 serine/threonine-protein kinase [Legionella brunensis]
MFSKLFFPLSKKVPQSVNIQPDIIQQKALIDQNLPLLNDIQIQKITQRIKETPTPPPFCLNSTPDVPFRILHDGTNTYVLSDIILGAGGEGIMRAGQLIDASGKSSWLAIKECFPGKEMRDMVILLITDENKFLENYEHSLRIMYTNKHPNTDYDELSQKELIEFFRQQLSTEITPVTKERSLQDAMKNITILNDLNIPATVFATDILVYFTMPLLRGEDLVMLSGAKEKNPSGVFDELIEAAQKNPDATKLYGSFVTSYAHVIDSIIEQISEFHRKNYLHRDIKPHNLMLLDTGKVQLIDFGSSVKMHQGVYTANDTAVCTPAYASPQQAEFAELHPKDDYNFTRADDIYSLGITLQELHAKRVIEAIFKLYPDLESKFTGMQQALTDLNAYEPKTRMDAMDFLDENFKHLTQALEVKQGLQLQHDDNHDKLIASIERYRLACYESSSQSNDVNLMIDGKEFSSKFAHDLLMGDLSSETIANNLLTIREQYEANPQMTAKDIMTTMDNLSFTRT